MTIGERIKELRIERGITQEELAKRMGYKTRSAVCQVERNGDNITSDRISAFAKALGVSIQDIMGWKNSDNKDNVNPSDTAAARLLQYYIKIEEYRMLLDAAKDSKPEDLKMAADLLKRLKGTN